MAVQEAPTLGVADNGVTTPIVTVPVAKPGRLVIYEHKGKIPPMPGIVRRAADDGRCQLTFFSPNTGQAVKADNVYHRDDPRYAPSHERNFGCWYETPGDEARKRVEAEHLETLRETILGIKAELREVKKQLAEKSAKGVTKQ